MSSSSTPTSWPWNEISPTDAPTEERTLFLSSRTLVSSTTTPSTTTSSSLPSPNMTQTVTSLAASAAAAAWAVAAAISAAATALSAAKSRSLMHTGHRLPPSALNTVHLPQVNGVAYSASVNPSGAAPLSPPELPAPAAPPPPPGTSSKSSGLWPETAMSSRRADTASMGEEAWASAARGSATRRTRRSESALEM